MSSAFGSALRFRSQEPACNDRLTIFRWTLDANSVGLGLLAAELGRAYVSDQQIWRHPDAVVAPRLPDGHHPTVRMGDLGELVGAALYRTRLGVEVPFLKIESKPVGSATGQGPDVLAVSLASVDEVRPVSVEVKARAGQGPGEILGAIGRSFETIDEGYLRSAWAAGVQLMSAHPDHQRAFALMAAQALARLVDPERTHPPHEAHAVAVVDRDNLTVKKAKEHWGLLPPVSELHVVEVLGLVGLRDELYETASRLTYGQLAAEAPTLLGAGSYTPGIAAPISSRDPGRQPPPVPPGPYASVVESALWYLADWDGLGLARAKAAREESDDRLVVGLGEILSGADRTAFRTLRDTALEAFADAASQVLQLNQPASALIASANQLAETSDDPELVQAVRHVTSALIYRLDRHPALLAAEQGASGPVVSYVIQRLQRIGRYALWPSQAQAVRGGLLDPGLPSVAVRMPTSAGKTTLIELLVAQALDTADQSVVAVLASTKALVTQLTGDLRQALPSEIEVRSSHGGLDFDTVSPAAGLVSGGGVAVMTPERFDLEWRRAVTGDSTSLSDLALLVVDEAHRSMTPNVALHWRSALPGRCAVVYVLPFSQASSHRWTGSLTGCEDFLLSRIGHLRGWTGSSTTG
ncbi:MAG: DEAD/DEAH box helicase [Actinobacteria bacterium]|nr:DEAD/DEAH box helicase [Actinomycetota bacterium]